MGSSLPSKRFTMDLAYERGIFIFTFKRVLCLNESKKTCFRKQGWRDRSGINFHLSDERNHRLVNLGRQDNLAILRKAKREGAKTAQLIYGRSRCDKVNRQNFKWTNQNLREAWRHLSILQTALWKSEIRLGLLLKIKPKITLCHGSKTLHVQLVTCKVFNNWP